MARQPGRVPDTEHQPKNIADATPKRNVLALASGKAERAYSQIEHKTYYKPDDVERIIPLLEVKKIDTHSYGCHQQKGGGI